jgi:hypothetical protein
MAWNRLHPATPAPQAQYAPAAPIPAASQVKVVTVPGPTQIVTRDKIQIVHDLQLPAAIAIDPDKQVTATGQVVNRDKSKVDAVSVLDTKTGVSEIDMKTEARPFFAFVNEREIGIRGGMTLRGLGGALYGRWTFLRTGDVHYAVYGEATSPPFAGTPVINATTATQGDGKIMLDISYRW